MDKFNNLPFEERLLLNFAKPEDIISLDYGEIYPGLYTAKDPHRGIDYIVPYGGNILSCHRGIVEFAATDNTGYGMLVILREIGSEFASFYAHLSGFTVSRGQVIEAKQVIGRCGSSGNVTGPHLHLECRTNFRDYKSHVNPNLYLPSLNQFKMDKIVQPAPPVNDVKVDSDLHLGEGAAEVISDYAFYRDDTLTVRVGLLHKGDKVHLTGNKKQSDNGLIFREAVVPTVYWIAEADSDGTQMLGMTE